MPVGEERLARAIEQGVFLADAQRPPAEVRRLGRGAALRSEHAHRVAGLPHVRGAARSLVDVPVPRARAARDPGRRGRARRHAQRRRSSRRRSGGEAGALGAQRARLAARAAAAPPSSAANAPKADGSPTISLRLSSRHEIVAFSSVSTTAHTLPGPHVSSCAASSVVVQRSSTPAPRLDVDAGDQRHGCAATVLEREAAREEAAELEPEAAVEAVAAAQ